MKIYIVRGHTGEYDDFTDWNVCAYKNKLDAQAHVDAANTELKKIFQSKEQEFEKEAQRQWEEWKNDPNEKWVCVFSYEEFYKTFDNRPFGKHYHEIGNYLRSIKWSLDPDIQTDYTGTKYDILEVELKEGFEK